MADPISVSINPAQVARVKLLLGGVKNGVPKLFTRTNNRVVSKAKTRASSIIREDVALPKKYLDPNFVIKKANFTDTSSSISMPQAGILLAFFPFNTLASGGLSVKIWTTGARTRLKTAYVIPRMRYTQTPKGAPAVAKAGVTDPRKRSDWLYGPSPSQSFGKEIEEETLRKELVAVQQAEFQAQLRFLLSSL